MLKFPGSGTQGTHKTLHAIPTGFNLILYMGEFLRHAFPAFPVAEMLGFSPLPCVPDAVPRQTALYQHVTKTRPDSRVSSAAATATAHWAEEISAGEASGVASSSWIS